MINLLRQSFWLGFFFISGFTFADPVWEFVNESEYSEILSSIETPENAFTALPVEISLPYLISLQREDEIEIKITSDI